MTLFYIINAVFDSYFRYLNDSTIFTKKKFLLIKWVHYRLS